MNAELAGDSIAQMGNVIDGGFALAQATSADAHDLSLATTATMADSMNQNTQSVLSQLNSGFATMGQFMQNATRSDGALVAESNNKMTQTVMLAFGGLAALGMVVFMFKGAK